jgi:twitching motility protein PilT
MARLRVAETLRAVVSQRLLPRADGRGLIPACEVLVTTRAVQDCMRHDDRTPQLQELIAQGRHYGMTSFDQSLLGLLRQGLVTREVALGAATSPTDLELAVRLGAEAGDDGAIERHNYGDQPQDELAGVRAGEPPSPPGAPPVRS